MIIDVLYVLRSCVRSLLVKSQIVVSQLSLKVSDLLGEFIVALLQHAEQFILFFDVLSLFFKFLDLIVDLVQFGSDEVHVEGFLLHLTTRALTSQFDTRDALHRYRSLGEFQISRESNWLEIGIVLKYIIVFTLMAVDNLAVG